MNGVKNVGWLDLSRKFPGGDVFPSPIQKLKVIAAGSRWFKPLVESLRESPTCQICGALELLDADGRLLPSAELWIPSHKYIYASPIAILHFIECHKYCPPAEYIAAIEALDSSIPFIADVIYRQKLVESGWFNRSR